jgi:hypothetical protein
VVAAELVVSEAGVGGAVGVVRRGRGGWGWRVMHLEACGLLGGGVGWAGRLLVVVGAELGMVEGPVTFRFLLRGIIVGSFADGACAGTRF